MDIISPEKERNITPSKNQNQIIYENYNSSGKMSEEQQQSEKKKINSFYDESNKENQSKNKPLVQEYFIPSDRKLSWTQYVKCPYNKAHIISEQYMIFHLCRCPDRDSEKFEACPFNSLHRFPINQLENHLGQCPDIPQNFDLQEYYNRANVDWSDAKYEYPEFYDFENTWMPEEEKEKLREMRKQNISKPEKLLIWETQRVFYSKGVQTEQQILQQQQQNNGFQLFQQQNNNNNQNSEDLDCLVAQMLRLEVNKQPIFDVGCQTDA